MQRLLERLSAYLGYGPHVVPLRARPLAPLPTPLDAINTTITGAPPRPPYSPARADATWSTAAAATEATPAEATLCVVCCDRERSRLLQPCHHVCLCDVCAARVEHCPICKEFIAMRWRAFLS